MRSILTCLRDAPVTRCSDRAVGREPAVRTAVRPGAYGNRSLLADGGVIHRGDRGVLSCRTRGPAWSSWFRSQNGRFKIYYEVHWDVTLNSGGDVAALLRELSRERSAG